MHNVYYMPTRYFPAISGAEFYIQRVAEILNSDYKYSVFVYTSNAIDFKGLKEPEGRLIKNDDRLFQVVNNLNINRYKVNYELDLEDVIKKVKKINEYTSLNLTDEVLAGLIKNGPVSLDLINELLKNGEYPPTLIHATFFPYFNLISSLIIGKKFNSPVVCTPFYHFANPRYLNSQLHEVLEKFDHLIACTNAEKKVLIERVGISPERISVIPMGVDIDKFSIKGKKSDKKPNFKQHYFKEDEKKFKMVLFCGYKNHEKGALSILKSIPYILKKMKRVYFVFIGPPTLAFNRELSKVRQTTDARIINFTPDNLTGYFDQKKIDAFKETDVFLMPSRSDAYGIAYLEAWAASKPVIGANIGATPEVIINNNDGWLVEFDDPIDISEKTVLLLKKKRLRK